MNANEFRIGNLLFDTDGRVHKITGHDLWSWEFADFEEIPLTTEWLERLGLKNRVIWVFEIFGDNKRGFHISSEGGEWIFIKYVHQLQNLYFALTGEELEVK